MIRCAVFAPTPGAREIAFASPVITARRSSSGRSADKMPSAPFGPMPLTPRSWRNISRSERLKKPYRLISSSRTCRCVYIFTSSPSGGKTSSTDIGTKIPIPIMPDSTTIRSFAFSARMPFTYEITVNSFLFSLVQDLVQTKKRTLQNASKSSFQYTIAQFSLQGKCGISNIYSAQLIEFHFYTLSGTYK